MNDNPTVKIQIGGHTDNVGKPTDNLALSNNRAKSVINYLISKGIPAARLSAKGFEKRNPLPITNRRRKSNEQENGDESEVSSSESGVRVYLKPPDS
jgi:outer membrane protein OmpA-like peptidoglycan-associated protein